MFSNSCNHKNLSDSESETDDTTSTESSNSSTENINQSEENFSNLSSGIKDYTQFDPREPAIYTNYRLTHSNEKHLVTTSRITFLGPIPHNWVSHNGARWLKDARSRDFLPSTIHHTISTYFPSLSQSLSLSSNYNLTRQNSYNTQNTDMELNTEEDSIFKDQFEQETKLYIERYERNVKKKIKAFNLKKVNDSSIQSLFRNYKDTTYIPIQYNVPLHKLKAYQHTLNLLNYQNDQPHLFNRTLNDNDTINTLDRNSIHDQVDLDYGTYSPAFLSPNPTQTLNLTPDSPQQDSSKDLISNSDPNSNQIQNSNSNLKSTEILKPKPILKNTLQSNYKTFSKKNVKNKISNISLNNTILSNFEGADPSFYTAPEPTDFTNSDNLSDDSSLENSKSNNQISNTSFNSITVKKRHTVKFDTSALNSLKSVLNNDTVTKTHLEEQVPKSLTSDDLDARSFLASRVPTLYSTNTTFQKNAKNKSEFNGIGSQKYLKSKKPGTIVKVERLLVKIINFGTEPIVGKINENSLIEARIISNWSEFIVVARTTGFKEFPIIFEFYSSRTFPRLGMEHISSKPKYAFKFGSSRSGACFYSLVDKSVSMWCMENDETYGFIIKHYSTGEAVQWLGFCLEVLGVFKTGKMTIEIPDLDLPIRVNINWLRKKASQEYLNMMNSHHNEDDSFLTKLLIHTVENLLASMPETCNILEYWKQQGKLGLSWKRYDRLEWIHGTNSRCLFGNWHLWNMYDLQLRIKKHYPSQIPLKYNKSINEPSPIEGFLSSLPVSLKKISNFGKLFFPTFYFATFNHLLVIIPVQKAFPPIPPGTNLDEMDEELLAGLMPHIYEICPFSLNENDKIKWYEERNDSLENAKLAYQYDMEALTEKNRRIDQFLSSVGVIDLTEIENIKHLNEEEEYGSGGLSNAVSNFHRRNAVSNVELIQQHSNNMKKSFEIIHSNGKVTKLMAYDSEMCDEWISRLQELSFYWKTRMILDMKNISIVQRNNIAKCNVDPSDEADFTLNAPKWETREAYADPIVHNYCMFANCRTIIVSGLLYCKGQIHANYKPYYVVLLSGYLVLFSYYSSSNEASRVLHLTHSTQKIIELRGCYVLSGSSAFTGESADYRESHTIRPGSQALPRVYSDGYMSVDENTSRCIVLWSGKKRPEVSKTDFHRRKRITKRFGTTSTSLILMARSRQEREKWVIALNNELNQIYDYEN